MISALIIGILTAIAVFIASIGFKKHFTSSVATKTKTLKRQIEEATSKAKDLTQYAPAYVSKLQLESVESLLGKEADTITSERKRLKDIEAKLENAQKLVEEKEGGQQETKASREEDEIKLRELLASFNDVSAESMGLERKLATSMKNLETLISEVKMTDIQKQIMNDLLSALTEGSSRVRELLTEYQAINDRLNAIQQQHGDLEEEYTKLVEQQLGE